MKDLNLGVTMKKVFMFIILGLTISTFSQAGQFSGEYEKKNSLSKNDCYAKINCHEQQCDIEIEKNNTMIKIQGTTKTDSQKKLHFYRKYTGYETRWFHKDAMTVIEQGIVERKRNGSFDITLRIEKINLWPHFPKKEKFEIKCKEMTKL